jgi:predicted ATPase
MTKTRMRTRMRTRIDERRTRRSRKEADKRWLGVGCVEERDRVRVQKKAQDMESGEAKHISQEDLLGRMTRCRPKSSQTLLGSKRRTFGEATGVKKYQRVASRMNAIVIAEKSFLISGTGEKARRID